MGKEKLKRAHGKIKSAYRDLNDLRDGGDYSRFGRVIHYVGQACLLLERIIGERTSPTVEADPQPSA